jgi:hypothetical protein
MREIHSKAEGKEKGKEILPLQSLTPKYPTSVLSHVAAFIMVEFQNHTSQTILLPTG